MNKEATIKEYIEKMLREYEIKNNCLEQLLTLTIGIVLIYFGNKIDTNDEIEDKNEDKAIIEKIL